MRDAAGELHDLQPAGDLAERVGVDLAVLGADQRGELVAVGVHQLAEAEQHLRPLDQRGVPPGGPGGRGGGHRRVHLRGRGQVDPPADLPVAGLKISEVRPSPSTGVPLIQWVTFFTILCS
nr:hypothetical protein GCM10020093_100980 [Planobispora longispora]